ARGFQVGWVAEKDRGMSARAILWGGSADDYIDLQLDLPEPWNVSQAMDVDVDGDTVRVIGTAQQAVQSGKYEMDAGTRPVVWEMKLLSAEPPARRETVTVQPTTAAAPAAMSDDRKVEKAASDLGAALVAEDYAAAHALLAPWLQRQVTPEQLRSILKKEF